MGPGYYSCSLLVEILNLARLYLNELPLNTALFFIKGVLRNLILVIFSWAGICECMCAFKEEFVENLFWTYKNVHFSLEEQMFLLKFFFGLHSVMIEGKRHCRNKKGPFY